MTEVRTLAQDAEDVPQGEETILIYINIYYIYNTFVGNNPYNPWNDIDNFDNNFFTSTRSAGER